MREERTMGNTMPSLTFKWNVFVLVWCGLVWFDVCFGVAWFAVGWCGVVYFAAIPAPKLRVEGPSPRAR